MEISRWREPPDTPKDRTRPGGCAGNSPTPTATSGADSVFGRDPVARATGKYQLSELTGRMGCRAACMGSARASRAVPCAPRGTPGVHRHSERLESPGVFREGAEYGTRGACAPPTTPACIFSPYSQSPYF